MIVKIFATHTSREFRVFGKSWPTNLSHLEQEISAWLEANPGISINDIKQSCAGGFLEQPKIVISIWYEPKG